MMRGMDVRMIWQRDPSSGILWLVDAWDDDSIMENADGWASALSNASEGDVDVRVVVATVDLDLIEKTFHPGRADLRHLRGDAQSHSTDPHTSHEFGSEA